MTPSDQAALLQRLLATFRVEADEHLSAMAALVRDLEDCGAERESSLVEALFREAHSLKGAARAVNLGDVESVCAALEETLAALKRRETALSPALLEMLHGSFDELARLLAQSPGTRKPVEAAPIPSPPAELAPGTAPPRSLRPTAHTGDTVRISTARLESLLVRSEAFIAHKLSAGHFAAQLRELATSVTAHKRRWSKTVRDVAAIRRAQGRSAGENGAALPEVERVLEAIERDELFVRHLETGLARLQASAEHEQRALAGLVDTLQEDMREVLMQPFGTLLELLPKLARDLARDSGKDVALVVDGAAIEVDRRILEAMKDPLIHLVRNAVDHGIESPARRTALGKPARGRIRIAVAARDNNRVELALSDDGAGLDVERVKASAAALGLAGTEDPERVSPGEAANLIFASGLSTSPILTDLSGRGLGLAIVREKVEMLGGSIAVEQPKEGGTLFRILLPSALATFRGVLVAVGECLFILPSASVARVARIERDAIRTVENREAVEIEGQALALVRLADVLGVATSSDEGGRLRLAVLQHAGRRIAFAVDDVLGDQEVLVKGLGPQLRRVPNIAGATVLQTGRLVPILNVPDLFVSALHARPAAPAATQSVEPERGSVLVVEDSITARSLLKNILEAAGYTVGTAVDGVDALTALATGHYKVVVSDVEMPRMNGFELTTRLRRDRRFADLPVVLVTALDSPADRERGVDAGANAYIVKSSFDQGNLLDAIRRLI